MFKRIRRWLWGSSPSLSHRKASASRRLLLEPLEERAVPAFVNSPSIITGQDTQAIPQLRVFNPLNGSLQISYNPPASQFPTGVRVAVGDVDGDGVADIVTGSGPGVPARVSVFSGQTFAQIATFFPFTTRLRAGVFVAVGNFDSDTPLEVVVGAGSRQFVRIFNITGGTGLQIPGILGNILASRDAATSARVAAGNVDGQPGDELIVALGKNRVPRVVVYNTAGVLLANFFAYNSTFRGGVFVTTGDVNGDGIEEIITTPDTGMETQVRIFNLNGSLIQSFRVFDPGFLGGGRVTTTDADGDGRADIVVGRGGLGGNPLVVVIDGQTLAQLDEFFAYDLTFSGGIFVAGI